MSRNTIDSVLNSISSLNIDNIVLESYTEVAESIRESGAPSNNILLTIILSEIRRGNDETMKLAAVVAELTKSMSVTCQQLLDSMERRNTILALIKISESDKSQQHKLKGKAGTSDWFYKAHKLTSKHHVFACIISHFISIVQLHIDNERVQYPDSVDCEFNLMIIMVRVVSSSTCKAKDVKYKARILLKPVNDQAFDTIYPYIVS